jgi:hypothetical protein
MQEINGLPGFNAVNQYGAVFNSTTQTMRHITKGDTITVTLTNAMNWATPLFYLTPGLSGYPCVITDAVVKSFIAANDPRVSDWLRIVDDDLNYKCREYDMIVSQFLMPIHPRIMEYAVAYFSFMAMRDNIGANNVNTYADEKYMVKYEVFRRELERTRRLLTKDIFWRQDLAIRGMQRIGGSAALVRG